MPDDEGKNQRILRGVAFDVDGTLLTSRHVVSPRMRFVCRALVERGLWLTIASARPPRSVLMIAAEIGATGPCCALNGAVIIARNGVVSARRSLPPQAAAGLIARFQADPRVSLSVFSGTEWLVPVLDARIQREADIVGFAPEVRPDLGGVGPVEKILLITDEPLAVQLTASLSAMESSVTVARSNPTYVEISAQGVDKMRGVEQAAGLAGLSLGEIVACGDGENDMTLVARSGYGIAMAHAPAALRAVARQVVGGNDDDSLAEALAALFSE
jgi:hypothetical protein